MPSLYLFVFFVRLRDMKYIGLKHQRENKQDSDKTTSITQSNPQFLTGTNMNDILNYLIVTGCTHG
jgi:hypothetical protein